MSSMKAERGGHFRHIWCGGWWRRWRNEMGHGDCFTAADFDLVGHTVCAAAGGDCTDAAGAPALVGEELWPGESGAGGDGGRVLPALGALDWAVAAQHDGLCQLCGSAGVALCRERGDCDYGGKEGDAADQLHPAAVWGGDQQCLWDHRRVDAADSA